ncbi:MAG: hypothetical protein NTX24_03185 [Candidatus Pacearchaeota archaeon]|nr:hypothetical protein [Candidatus Pacearchaeota archaeon]
MRQNDENPENFQHAEKARLFLAERLLKSIKDIKAEFFMIKWKGILITT